MEFIVTYKFTDPEQQSTEVDIVKYPNYAACQAAYDTPEYKCVTIEVYDEKEVQKEIDYFLRLKEK